MEIDVVRPRPRAATRCPPWSHWPSCERLRVEGSPCGCGRGLSARVHTSEDGARHGPLRPLCWQKADKSALAAKVSRVQFDATTEQLNHMMQELLAKMSGQEQDWQKILDRLLTEMDNKVRGRKEAPGFPGLGQRRRSRHCRPPTHSLGTHRAPPPAHPQLDRLELDPVKHVLEDRWKSLRQQLKERPPLYQADEAAAMRRWGPADGGAAGSLSEGGRGVPRQTAPASTRRTPGEWLIPPRTVPQ